MPIYEYECRKCSFIDEQYFPIKEAPKKIKCIECNGVAVKLIGKPQVMAQGEGVRDLRGERIWFPRDGKPYYDRSLQRTFNSPKEKKEYLDKNNLIMDGSSTKIRIESGDLRSKETRKILKMED